MREILVNDLQNHLRGLKRRVAAALRHTLRAEGCDAYALSVALVDDAAIARLNEEFLNHAGPTDVLSFPLADESEPTLRGEIVVSAERAVAVARQRGVEPRGELLLYAVHGGLHLIGYDDQSPADARRMHRRENELLAELGYPNAFGPVK